MRIRRQSAGLAIAFVLVLLGTGCGGDDDAGAQDTQAAGTQTAGGEIEGTINVSGSSTVEPITVRVAERFSDVEPGVEVNVDGPGTGDGFVLFCNGETDISDASRPIKGPEAQDCAANGIDFIELKVGIDGLAVMTNPANDAVTCLNFADLYALIGPESQGFEKWSDGQAVADDLGSQTDLPDADLTLAGPGQESGTYDSFVELALEDIAEARAETGKVTDDQVGATRPDYQSSSDDNIIIQGIEGAETSLGWVGYAFASEAGDAVKLLEVAEEPGGECVAATAETISAGSYPLSRALYVYVNKTRLENKPALAAFVDFYLNEGAGAVGEVGYVELADDDLAVTRAVWESREAGTRDGGS